MTRRTAAAIAAILIGLAALGTFAMLVIRPFGAGPPAAAFGPPQFVDETAASGVDHVYGGEFTFVVGGGVAVFDCNADGRAELYLPGGEAPASLYVNDSPVGGALRFTALPSPVTDLGRVNGAYPLDVDGDGTVDLAVLRSGDSTLLRGLGDCRFEDAGDRWFLSPITGQTEAFSATWETEASLPTLAFGNYLELDASGEAGEECDGNLLIRPDATGMAYAAALPLEPGYCALSMLFSDWDRSGRRDLRISNDRHYYDAVNGEEQLWRIAPGEAPRRYTADDGWVQMQIWGMGIASQDLTDDGYPEVYLTTQGANKLQTLTAGPDQPTYRDIGRRRTADAPTPFTGGDLAPSTAWHPEFADVNNDRYLDLFVSKGNVDEQLDYALRDPSNLMLGQADGTFVEAADRAGILSFARGRGAALADFNLDGLLDLVEVNLREPVRIWRNVGGGDAEAPAPMGNWVAIQVTQPGANHDAIGAWVELKAGGPTLERELTVGGGHTGGQIGWVHFGLGDADRADVRVRWPDGEIGPWLPVEADTFGIVERGASAVRTWQAQEP
jgi:enediyne biosynthesis protein E4